MSSSRSTAGWKMSPKPRSAANRSAWPRLESSRGWVRRMPSRAHPSLAVQPEKKSSSCRSRSPDLPGWEPVPADPDGEIEALVDEVHDPIAERELGLDLRMRFHELGHERRHDERAEVHGGADPELPTRSALQDLSSELRCTDLLQNPCAGVVVLATELGQGLPPSGTDQEPCAEPFLEGSKVPSGHRGGHAERARRGPETAQLHGPHQDFHREEAIHDSKL